MSAYYAVRVGRVTGVYRTWDEASKQVQGFTGAVHKKFKTALDAQAYLAGSSNAVAPPTVTASVSGCVAASSSLFSSSSSSSSSNPACRCGKASAKRVSKKDNANRGREFYTCGTNVCNFFKWADALSDGGGGNERAYDLVFYTDGGCLGNQNVAHVVNPAGWGVVVLSGGTGEADVAGAIEPLAELYGPVVISPTSAFHLGAAVCSNNTGELTAIGEALLWLRDSADERMFCACATEAACTCRPCAMSIRYDSMYAAKSVTGEFNGEKNKPLIMSIRRLYDALKFPSGTSACTAARAPPRRRRPVDFTWTKVKSHSGDRWNERADQLASLGIQGRVCSVGRYGQSATADGDGGDNGPFAKKQRSGVDGH